MPPCFCNMLNIYILSFQVELQEYDMSKSLNSTQFGKTSIVLKFLKSLKTQISRSQIMQAPLKTLFQINTFFFPENTFFLFNYNFITFFALVHGIGATYRFVFLYWMFIVLLFSLKAPCFIFRYSSPLMMLLCVMYFTFHAYLPFLVGS